MYVFYSEQQTDGQTDSILYLLDICLNRKTNEIMNRVRFYIHPDDLKALQLKKEQNGNLFLESFVSHYQLVNQFTKVKGCLYRTILLTLNRYGFPLQLRFS